MIPDRRAATFERIDAETLRGDADWWRIYEASFPADEREPAPVIYRSLELGTGFALRVGLAGRTVGMATGHVLRRVPAVFCPYIALDPTLRGGGLGGPLLDALYDAGAAMLEAFGLRSRGLVWEVESLEQASGDALETRRRRVGFFERQGGRLLACRYIQPPVDGHTLVPMHLMFRPAPGLELPSDEGQRALVEAIYFEKYGEANRIDAGLLQGLIERLC